VGESSHPGLREPDQRRLLIGQQAEAQGVGQQLPREGSLVSFSHQPPKVTAEGTHVLREFLTLVRSLVKMEMPKPALVRGVTDQELPGYL
jgi:hypothetical protein